MWQWTICNKRIPAALVVALALPAAAQVPQTAAAGANLLAEAARAVGVKRCLDAVERLSVLAIAGSRNHDVLIDWDRKQPDAGPFFSMMGVSFGQQSIAATIT